MALDGAWCSAASPGGTPRNVIREESIVAETTSLAVWDVPMPVVAGERFAITVGAEHGSGRAEIRDSAGAVVASATLGDTPWPGTRVLHWVSLDVPAPAKAEVARYAVRCGGAETWFSVVAAAKPDCTLTVQVTERDAKAALGDVEIRLGPFHARTDKTGRAELRVCKGEYGLVLWKTAHIAQPQRIAVDGDGRIELTMVNVPEEHPDARWVR
jgi:hypothetical protein